MLAEISIPSFQAVIVEDISDMAIGHLGSGLLEAHGLDEGGVVGRIRQDERIHLDSLCLVLGEARQLTFRTLEGGTVSGHTLIDPFWTQLVRWATVDQPMLLAERTRQQMHERILAHPSAKRLLAEFEALATA